MGHKGDTALHRWRDGSWERTARGVSPGQELSSPRAAGLQRGLSVASWVTGAAETSEQTVCRASPCCRDEAGGSPLSQGLPGPHMQ